MTRIAKLVMTYEITVSPVNYTQITFNGTAVAGGTTQKFRVRGTTQVKYKATSAGYDNTSLIINGVKHYTTTGNNESTVNVMFNAKATIVTERWNDPVGK